MLGDPVVGPPGEEEVGHMVRCSHRLVPTGEGREGEERGGDEEKGRGENRGRGEERDERKGEKRNRERCVGVHALYVFS